MGKKSSLSQVQHAQSVTLHREGFSESKVSAKCNVSKTEVYTTIANCIPRRSYSDLKRSDQSKETTVRDDQLLKR